MNVNKLKKVLILLIAVCFFGAVYLLVPIVSPKVQVQYLFSTVEQNGKTAIQATVWLEPKTKYDIKSAEVEMEWTKDGRHIFYTIEEMNCEQTYYFVSKILEMDQFPDGMDTKILSVSVEGIAGDIVFMIALFSSSIFGIVKLVELEKEERRKSYK